LLGDLSWSLEEKKLELQQLHEKCEQMQLHIHNLESGAAAVIPGSRSDYGNGSNKRQRLEELAPELAARVINSNGARARNIRKPQWQAIFTALEMGAPPEDREEAAMALLQRLLD
jgi:hypothetical protein